MAKTKISEWSQTAANNTDLNGISCAEGMAPSDVNNWMRELMAQVKDFQVGADGDPLTVAGTFVAQGRADIGGALNVAGVTALTGTLTAAAGIVANITGNVTGNVTGDVSGNAGTVTNGVYTTGDQTIGGAKTFSSTIVGDVSGNAGTVTNGVYTTDFTSTNQSIGSRGYQKLPGGLIIQWGVDTEATSINFPIAFPNACLSITASATPLGDRGADMTVVINSASSFGIRLGGSVGDGQGYWIAIGY